MFSGMVMLLLLKTAINSELTRIYMMNRPSLKLQNNFNILLIDHKLKNNTLGVSDHSSNGILEMITDFDRKYN